MLWRHFHTLRMRRRRPLAHHQIWERVHPGFHRPPKFTRAGSRRVVYDVILFSRWTCGTSTEIEKVSGGASTWGCDALRGSCARRHVVLVHPIEKSLIFQHKHLLVNTFLCNIDFFFKPHSNFFLLSFRTLRKIAVTCTFVWIVHVWHNFLLKGKQSLICKEILVCTFSFSL